MDNNFVFRFVDAFHSTKVKQKPSIEDTFIGVMSQGMRFSKTVKKKKRMSEFLHWRKTWEETEQTRKHRQKTLVQRNLVN